MKRLCASWLCPIAFVLALCPLGSQAQTSQPTALLWQIGRPDGNDVELALGPDGWADYTAKFPDDPVFVVGRSDARRDWPYVQPGPADAWAGSRPHTFTIYFGLAAPIRPCLLEFQFVDTHSSAPPKLQIDLNGLLYEYQPPKGGSDESLNGKPEAGKSLRYQLNIPERVLKVGTNTFRIRTLTGSWVIYDSLSLKGPEDAVASEVKPTTMILGVQSAPALLKQADGRRAQQLQVAVQHLGEAADATISVDDATPVALPLKPGNRQVLLTIPAVEEPKSVHVALKVGDKTLVEQTADVEPVRPRVLYLLPHSHNDIGYTQIQTEVEKKQWEYLEQAIATARKTADYPAGARFKWNVEVMWAVDSYLRQASPEKQQAFVDAVKAGWIELDALYGNELTALCRPEELVRLIECGERVAHRCGVPLETAMISDVPGYTWGLTTVLADAGVKYFSVGPNPSDRIGGTLAEWGDKPFYWVAPTGKQEVLCWVAGRGYAMFHGGNLAKTGEQPILAYVWQLDQTDYPYEFVQVRYSVGGDNGPPDPSMCDFVKSWNEKYASPRLVIATAGEMCRDLEARYRDDIPRVSGDFTPYWEDGAASSALETGINRATAERLVQAETLYAMLAPEKYPADDFAAAWRNVILYDEHTWGAWNSISEPDAPFVKQQWKIKQAFALDGEKQSRKLLADALATRGSNDEKVGAIDVFNTTSWQRRDLVTLPKDLSAAGDMVKDSTDEVIPSQRLVSGELAFLAMSVPPLAAERFTVGPGKPGEFPVKASASGTTLTNGSVVLTIDAESGAIGSLRLANPGWVLRDSSGREIGGQPPGSAWELAEPNSAIGLNGFRYMLGSDAAGAKANQPATVTVKEAGPLVASLLIESDAPGCKKLSREVRVVAGLHRIDIIDTVDKKAVREKEGVHFGFAFNVPDGVMRMDIPWAVMRPEADQLPGACKNWFTVQRWVDISNADHGVTWATLDAPLVEVGGLTADRIGSLPNPKDWISQLAPSQTLYSWVMNNHWHTNYRAEQEGVTTFRYSILPHQGGFSSVSAEQFGVEQSQPLIEARAVGPKPPTVHLLSVAPPSVLVVSVKPSGKGAGLVARLFNPSEHGVSATLDWSALTPKTIWLSNLGGEKTSKVNGPIELPPWGIATLYCEQP